MTLTMMRLVFPVFNTAEREREREREREKEREIKPIQHKLPNWKCLAVRVRRSRPTVKPSGSGRLDSRSSRPEPDV